MKTKTSCHVIDLKPDVKRFFVDKYKYFYFY